MCDTVSHVPSALATPVVIHCAFLGYVMGLFGVPDAPWSACFEGRRALRDRPLTKVSIGCARFVGGSFLAKLLGISYA